MQMLNEGDPSIVEWVCLFFLGLLISFCFGLLSRKERTILAPVLSEDVLIMPCKGILKACAMSLPVSWCYTCVVFFSFFSFFLYKHPIILVDDVIGKLLFRTYGKVVAT